ncbi:hypothetical protein TIFTF001_046259, partial [Ficus carica]
MWAASCLASCCAACACDACRTVVSGISRRSARIAYCGLFALSLIVSWILREVAAPLMEKLPCIIIMKRKLGLSVVMILWTYSEFVCLNNCARGYCHWKLFSDFNHDLEWNVWLKKVGDVDFGMRARINSFNHTPSREWFETDAVLRVSLGNFLFFTILAVLMVGVKSQRDPRDGLHHGGWMMKIICWCLLVIFTFFLPNEIINLYETTSKFGSGMFLLVQVILLLDFVHRWNDTWVGYDEQFWYIALFVVSLFCYVATFVFSGLLFHWFTPSGHDCGLNTFFIVMTLISVFVSATVALHPTFLGYDTMYAYGCGVSVTDFDTGVKCDLRDSSVYQCG